MIKNGLYDKYPIAYINRLDSKGRADKVMAFMYYWHHYQNGTVQANAYYAKLWHNSYRSRGKDNIGMGANTAREWIIEFKEEIRKFEVSWELMESVKIAENSHVDKSIDNQSTINDNKKSASKTEIMDSKKSQSTINRQSIDTNIKRKDNILSAKLKFSDEDMIIAQKLFDSIRLKDERFKEPNLNKWAEEVRLMVEKDGRIHKGISNVIDYIFSNIYPFNTYDGSFWQSNVLSMGKLRKQYGAISIQITNSRNQRKKAG